MNLIKHDTGIRKHTRTNQKRRSQVKCGAEGFLSNRTEVPDVPRLKLPFGTN